MFKSVQTKILGSISLLATLTGALFYLFKGEGHKSGKFLLLAGLPLAINLYTVHCVIFGNCTVYSWLLTLVLTMYAAAVFILYANLFVKGQQLQKAVVEKTTEARTLQSAVETSLGMN